MSQSKQGGYATATVIGVMAVLSLGASALLNLSLTENQRAKRIVSLAQIDLQLESKLNRLISDALNDPGIFTLGESTLEEEFVIQISDEQARPNLLRDGEELLRSELNKIDIAPSTRSAILAVRNKGSSVRHFSDIEAGGSLTDQDIRCAEEHFTLYRSTLNPLTRSNVETLDGAIIRFDLKTRAPGSPRRHLRAIVLFTGDRLTPYHIMDWRQDSDTESPTCKAL